MKIGNVDVGSGVLLAPLAGVTDLAMRKMCKKYGADLTVTEMVSARGLMQKGVNSEQLLLTADNETPVAVQLFGADAFVLAEAAACDVLKKFEIIDINMGCPVPKVTKTGAGSALMRSIDRAACIVASVVRVAARPVTVKFRLGWDDASKNYLDFGKAMEAAGAAAVTLHARTRDQGYAGTADWNAIAQLREALTVPVIANGDVTSVETYHALRAQTGCDMVMIGRGAMGRPTIFDECKGKTAFPSVRELIIEHIGYLQQTYPDRYVINSMRAHLGHYIKGIAGAREARTVLNTETTVEGVLRVVNDLFEGRYGAGVDDRFPETVEA